MVPLSRLPGGDLKLLRRLVARDGLLSFYLALAEAEAVRGEDASVVLIGPARRGAALGARFDRLTVVSTAGALDDDDLRLLLRCPGRLELHLTDAHHAQLSALAPQRVWPTRRMVAMQAPAGGSSADPDATMLNRAGFADAAAAMAAHNPETVLSARMADLPLAAIREGGRIIALAGTIGIAGETALLGHFLTVPEARGRGLARRLALHLRWHFAQRGIRRLLLATTEDNGPACRAYAAAGFTVLDRRLQVERLGELASPGASSRIGSACGGEGHFRTNGPVSGMSGMMPGALLRAIDAVEGRSGTRSVTRLRALLLPLNAPRDTPAAPPAAPAVRPLFPQA